jgi:soluble lytic murein transglycosylase-like protein
MTSKNTKQALTLAGIITAAALTLTSKPDTSIPKDYYDKAGPKISLTKDFSDSRWIRYSDILDNDVDTLKAREKDYRALDSLVNEAKRYMPLIFEKGYSDSVLNILVDQAVNRPMINQEALVNSILDTIRTYTEVVSKDFVKASVKEESWYNSKAESKTGALGFMQFTRSAWKHFGEESYLPNVYDPEKNIRAGIKYYKWMEEEFSKNNPKWNELTVSEKRDLLAAGYNGGPYKLMRKNWDIDKMHQESIEHAKKINDAMISFHREELYKNIALHRNRVENHDRESGNAFWLAYDAAHTDSFIDNRKSI